MPLRIRFLMTLLFALILFALPTVGTAQTPPQVSPTVTLIPGQMVSGSMTGSDAPLTYSILLPRGQDVVFEFNSEGGFKVSVCLRSNIINGNAFGECIDNNMEQESVFSLQQLVSSTDEPDRREFAEMTISRDSVSSAYFSLTAYVLTPVELIFRDIDAQSDSEQPYQTYTLRAADDLPFTVQIEDAAVQGNFLWAAYLPASVSEFERSPDIALPIMVDGAGINGDPEGIQLLRLFYLGAETYRVLVRAGHAYALHTTLALTNPLLAGEVARVTVSYQRPVAVIPFTLDGEASAQVDFRLVDGDGVVVIAQGADNMPDEQAGLGQDGLGDEPSPLEQSLTVPLEDAAAAYAIIQIPAQFTRSSVQVEVRWSEATRG